MSKKDYGSGKPKSKTVKISPSLHEAIDIFLKTETGRLSGYRSYVDFVNDAIRLLFKEFGIPEGPTEEERAVLQSLVVEAKENLTINTVAAKKSDKDTSENEKPIEELCL